MCVALVASLTEEMAAQNIAYHAHETADGVASLTEEMAARSIAYHARGTADGDKFCCYPWDHGLCAMTLIQQCIAPSGSPPR